MATVYLARDLRHDRPVALKVLHPELGRERSGPSASCARSARPPGSSTRTSCRSTTRARPQGLLWYTMPYVEGETLRERLERRGRCRWRGACGIAREVADALDYAHRARRRPPRHQAREHPARRAATRGWPTSASPRALARRPAAASGSPGPGVAVGHAGLHEPRAGGRRRAARRPQRHLLAGLRALRDARRRAAVHRAHPAGRHRAGASWSPRPRSAACARRCRWRGGRR